MQGSDVNVKTARYPAQRPGSETRGRAFRIQAALCEAFVVAALGLAVVPAHAEVDLSGLWAERRHEDQPERGPGPSLVEYEGLPINESARQLGLAYDPSILTLEEFQCRPHPADYGSRHSQFRMWKDVDSVTQEVVAWRTRREWQAPERTFYMDGRDRPPEFAGHSWQGFTKAKWDGDVLAAETTHLKMAYLRRNGVPRSDLATLSEHYLRHGNYLTVVAVLKDPVYLTEPMIRSSDYALDARRTIAPYPCDIVVEIADRKPGYVPHYLPGKNPFQMEYAQQHNLPLDAVLGGAKTMYPEYMEAAAKGAR